MNYEINGMYSDDFSGFFVVFYVIYMLFCLAIPIATYVMQSISLYTIADRRGIRNPWLSWLPVGDAWILGCISDQYRYVTRSQVKNKRKVLLVLNILMYGIIAGILAVLLSTLPSLIQLETNQIPAEMLPDFLGVLFGAMGLYLVLFGIAIAVAVVRYIALYDLYRSCEPSNAAMYLVLSIFISITMPIFLLVCRKKDLGMPPRRQPAPIPEPWTQPE